MDKPKKLATQDENKQNTKSFNKRQRIPEGQTKMDNLEKLATQCTQDEEKHNTICVGHHYMQTNIKKT